MISNMIKTKLFLVALLFGITLSPLGINVASAQTAGTLSALQVVTKNYIANPNNNTRNMLLSMLQQASSEASTPGNTTQPNAQTIEQAANNALKIPVKGSSTFQMNAVTSQQITKDAAQTASVVAKGGSCAPKNAGGPELTCASGLECDNNGICNPTPKSGSVATGGWCGSNDQACMASGDTCNSSGICVTNPAAGTPSSAAPANGGFVALTNLPVLKNLTTAPDLGTFLNAIYKYCVGLAAVLAVIQIMRAGIIYMGGDSVTEVKQARELISTAILGLVLVLSPVLVFSIIDKRILNLNIGSDFSALSTSSDSPAASSADAATPNTADGTVQPGGDCTTDTNCQNQNGLDYICQPEGGGTCTYNPSASPTVVSCTLDGTVADQCSDCPSHMCTATGENGTVYCALDNTTASSCAACPSKTCSASVSTGP